MNNQPYEVSKLSLTLTTARDQAVAAMQRISSSKVYAANEVERQRVLADLQEIVESIDRWKVWM